MAERGAKEKNLGMETTLTLQDQGLAHPQSPSPHQATLLRAPLLPMLHPLPQQMGRGLHLQIHGLTSSPEPHRHKTRAGKSMEDGKSRDGKSHICNSGLREDHSSPHKQPPGDGKKKAPHRKKEEKITARDGKRTRDGMITKDGWSRELRKEKEKTTAKDGRITKDARITR